MAGLVRLVPAIHAPQYAGRALTFAMAMPISQHRRNGTIWVRGSRPRMTGRIAEGATLEHLPPLQSSA
jgi:hypothetical protein